MGIGRAAILGASASWLGALASFVLRFAVNALLARLIAPDVFGRFALAFVYSELLGIIIAAGFGHAIVQLPETPEQTIPGAIQLNALVGGLLMLGSAVAYPFALRGDGLEVANLVVLLSATRAATIIAGTYDSVLQRQLAFTRLAVVRMYATVLSAAGSLALAWSHRPFAALFAREATAPILTAFFLLTEIKIDWKEVFHPSAATRSVRKKVFDIGRSHFWVQALEILYQRVDQLVFAKVLGAREFAYYYQARYVVGLPHAAVAPATQTVALRVFVEVAEDAPKMKRTIELLQVVVSHLLMLCAIPLAFAPHTLVALAYGPRWAGIADMLPPLAAWVVLQPLSRNSQLALMALRQWRAIRLAQIAQLVCLAVCVPPLVLGFGARGAAWSLSIATLAAMVTMRRGVGPEQRPALWVYRGVLFGAAVLTAFWALSRALGKGTLTEMSLTAAAVVLYAGATTLADPRRIPDIVQFMRAQLKRSPVSPAPTSAPAGSGDEHVSGSA